MEILFPPEAISQLSSICQGLRTGMKEKCSFFTQLPLMIGKKFDGIYYKLFQEIELLVVNNNNTNKVYLQIITTHEIIAA